MTVLHVAVKIGNEQIVKLLLATKGIDINIEDNKGKKPIEYTRNEEITQLLSQ